MFMLKIDDFRFKFHLTAILSVVSDFSSHIRQHFAEIALFWTIFHL